jgi:hypothetical protein
MDLSSNRNEYHEYFRGGGGSEGGLWLGLTTLTPSRADCLEIWEPQPPGTIRACSGLYWNSFTFTFTDRKNALSPSKVRLLYFCVISGFSRDVNEICFLLRFYAAWKSSFIPKFRNNLSVPSSKVKQPK